MYDGFDFELVLHKNLRQGNCMRNERADRLGEVRCVWKFTFWVIPEWNSSRCHTCHCLAKCGINLAFPKLTPSCLLQSSKATLRFRLCLPPMILTLCPSPKTAAATLKRFRQRFQEEPKIKPKPLKLSPFIAAKMCRLWRTIFEFFSNVSQKQRQQNGDQNQKQK